MFSCDYCEIVKNRPVLKTICERLLLDTLPPVPVLMSRKFPNEGREFSSLNGPCVTGIALIIVIG